MIRLVRILCQINGAPRHFQLIAMRALGYALDDVTITVARGELHTRIRLRRVFAQDRINEAHVLEEVAPIQSREQAHARDDVADSDLRRRLSLMLKMHKLLWGTAALFKPLLEAVEDTYHNRVLIAQALNQMHDESPAKLLAPFPTLSDDGEQLFGRPRGHVEQFVREHVRLFSLFARGADTRGQAAQVFDERQAQADRQSPDFADGQSRNALVGADEAAQGLAIKTAVRVRDERESDGIDARVTFKLSFRELGQFVVITPGQVFADFAQLFFDDVKVINEPFGCGRDRAFVANGVCERAIGGDQLATVLFETRQQLAPALRFCRDFVLGG